MGQSTPAAGNVIDPALAARIVDLAERDGPRAAFAVLSQRLSSMQTEGLQVPPHLVTLKDRLAAECCAMSQGR